jgi:hypothetical protein
MDLKIIKIPHRTVRAFTFRTTDGVEEADALIKLYRINPEKIKNIIPQTKIVDVSKIQVNNEFGIKITTLNIDYILKHYEINNETIIHLVDSLGGDADRCLLTNEKIPYKFKLDYTICEVV